MCPNIIVFTVLLLAVPLLAMVSSWPLDVPVDNAFKGRGLGSIFEEEIGKFNSETGRYDRYREATSDSGDRALQRPLPSFKLPHESEVVDPLTKGGVGPPRRLIRRSGRYYDYDGDKQLQDNVKLGSDADLAPQVSRDRRQDGTDDDYEAEDQGHRDPEENREEQEDDVQEEEQNDQAQGMRDNDFGFDENTDPQQSEGDDGLEKDLNWKVGDEEMTRTRARLPIYKYEGDEGAKELKVANKHGEQQDEGQTKNESEESIKTEADKQNSK